VLQWRTSPALRKALNQACIGEKWGDDVSANVVPAALQEALQQTEAQIKGRLLQLYPNDRAASDHPPCISPLIHL
jgi:hypothetical protein